MLSLKNAMIQTAALSWRILILMHLFMQDVVMLGYKWDDQDNWQDGWTSNPSAFIVMSRINALIAHAPRSCSILWDALKTLCIRKLCSWAHFPCLPCSHMGLFDCSGDPHGVPGSALTVRFAGTWWRAWYWYHFHSLSSKESPCQRTSPY